MWAKPNQLTTAGTARPLRVAYLIDTDDCPDQLLDRIFAEAYGRWGGIIKNGKTDYVSGYHPLFLLAKSAIRLPQRPYILGSVALLYGYLKAYWEGTPRVDDPELIRYLRSQQIAKLVGRETMWK